MPTNDILAMRDILDLDHAGRIDLTINAAYGKRWASKCPKPFKLVPHGESPMDEHPRLETVADMNFVLLNATHQPEFTLYIEWQYLFGILAHYNMHIQSLNQTIMKIMDVHALLSSDICKILDGDMVGYATFVKSDDMVSQELLTVDVWQQRLLDSSAQMAHLDNDVGAGYIPPSPRKITQESIQTNTLDKAKRLDKIPITKGFVETYARHEHDDSDFARFIFIETADYDTRRFTNLINKYKLEGYEVLAFNILSRAQTYQTVETKGMFRDVFDILVPKFLGMPVNYTVD